MKYVQYYYKVSQKKVTFRKAEQVAKCGFFLGHLVVIVGIVIVNFDI